MVLTSFLDFLSLCAEIENEVLIISTGDDDERLPALVKAVLHVSGNLVALQTWLIISVVVIVVAVVVVMLFGFEMWVCL